MSPFHHHSVAYHRLEFLGDRVLNLIVSRYLFRKFPEYTEGELTNALRFTSNDNLEEIVRELPEEFRKDLFIFKGRFSQDEHTSNADAVEAFLGNYFLEHGLDATTGYVEGIFGLYIDRFNPDADYISRLKVHAEKERVPLEYVPDFTETGPDNREIFHYKVLMNGVVCGTGSGSSHEKAKKAAAGEALRRMGGEGKS
jgi:ribonuclease III